MENSAKDKIPTLESAMKNNYKKTRVLNWSVALIFIIGFSLMILKSQNISESIGILIFGFFFAGVPALTAIALTDDRIYFFSFSFYVSTKVRKGIKMAMFGANLIILLFGVIGIYLSISTQQYLTVFVPLIFLTLAILNITALKKIVYS